MTKRTALIPALVAGAVLACVAAVLAVPAKEAEAAFPGQNGRIAFVSYVDNGTNVAPEIFTVLPDGTQRRQLTTASGSRAPDFSADGTKITYAGSRDLAESDQDVYVMDRAGNGKRALTDNDLRENSPAWSPDGAQIAFTRQGPAGQGSPTDVDVWVMNADGSGERNLTGDLDGSSGGAEWSPDGTRIVFEHGGDIWMMDVDGSGKRNLTPDAAMDAFPDWSPDGKKLAFASYRQYKPYEIYTMNLDGTGVINVTKTRYVNEAEPAWSPNGTRIAYRKDSVIANGGTTTEIRTKNADGSGKPKDISNDPENNFWPDWGPRLTTAP